MTEKDEAKEKRKIKAVPRMKEIMTAYYIDAKTAEQTGKKVAWITSGGPVEPLIAMDVIPVYPENHGAMIGASQDGGGSLREGRGDGVFERPVLLRPRRISPAHRSTAVRSAASPGPTCSSAATTSAGRSSNGTRCRPGSSRSRSSSSTPPSATRNFPQEAKRYVRSQINEYIAFLENVCKKKFDHDRMAGGGEALRRGSRGSGRRSSTRR